MSASHKLRRFAHCAATLGRTPGERAAILWALSRNLRVRLGLARYYPERVRVLRTRFGDIHVRDNFGDVTNLPGLLVENTYRVAVLQGEGAVLDVGANIGLFSLWMAYHNPGRPIHCFEPLADNARMVRRNCPSATVNQVGVGAVPSTVRLGVDAHGTMASSVDQRWALEAAEFPVVALDAYAAERGLGPVAFMKVDTEGMELDVLDGARALLQRTARVAMETHGPERHAGAIERLRAAGFAIDAEERHGATGMIFASARRD